MLGVGPKRTEERDRKGPAADRGGHRGIEPGRDGIAARLRSGTRRDEGDKRPPAELGLGAQVSPEHRERMVRLGYHHYDVMGQELGSRR